MKNKDNPGMPDPTGPKKKSLMSGLSDSKPVKYLQKKINEPFVLSSLFDFKKRVLTVLLVSGQLIQSVF